MAWTLRAGLPGLDSVTRVSDRAVAAGVPVSFRLDYTEGDDPVSYVAVTLADPSGTTRTLRAGNPAPGMILSGPSSSLWQNGDYALAEVVFVDRTGRVTLYRAGGSLFAEPALSGAPVRHAVDLAGAGFALSGGADATSLPVLTSLRRASADRLAAGGSVVFAVGHAGGATLSRP